MPKPSAKNALAMKADPSPAGRRKLVTRALEYRTGTLIEIAMAAMPSAQCTASISAIVPAIGSANASSGKARQCRTHAKLSRTAARSDLTLCRKRGPSAEWKSLPAAIGPRRPRQSQLQAAPWGGALYYNSDAKAEFAEMVGETGFEPATPCTQNRCATRLRHSPTLFQLLRF